jgi:hypothetical protein
MAYRYCYRVRRRWLRRRDRRNLAAAVLAGLALAVLVHASASGKPLAADPATLTAVPAGGAYTPQTWAPVFLAVIGEPRTPCNLAAIEAWEAAEGGAWNGAATDNPLNTVRPEPGSYAINSDGVQAYPSWQEGLRGNVAAITNGLYGPVLAALAAGDNAQAVADAVAASPWGTHSFAATC